MATEGKSQNTKSKILGLIEIERHRGLNTHTAFEVWTVMAIECLLEAELARIEKKELDHA